MSLVIANCRHANAIRNLRMFSESSGSPGPEGESGPDHLTLYRLQRRLHHSPRVRHTIHDAGVTAAPWIAADTAARAHTIPIRIQRARMLGINRSGVLVLHQRFHHAEHIAHPGVDKHLLV